MKLHGKTRLSLFRDGVEVKRIEKHNAITPFIQGAIKEGNFNMAIPNSAIMPLTQWFDGCVLTDGENDPLVGMIDHDSTTTACAGNTADSGSADSRRGAANTFETQDITGGRRFVWDWSTDRGNGLISSVCLTKSALAISEISETAFPSANPLNVVLATNTGNANGVGNLTIVDYEKEVGYLVSYSSGIVVDEYPLSTKKLNLIGAPFMKQIGYDGTAIHTLHNIPSSTISSPAPNIGNSSISYTGSHIHWITWNNDTIKDYVVNTSTWELDPAYGTGGIITRTFTGVTFSNIRYNGTYNWNYHKDVCPIIGNYVWMTGTVGGVLKMLKCNLLGNAPTEIFEYDNPFSTLNVGGQYVNGCSVVLPNGDFIKTPSANSNDSSVWGKALLYHNDKFYASRATFDFAGAGAYDTYGMCGINSNVYGTLLDGSYRGNDSSSMAHLSLVHGFVSTVNNIEAVTKTANLSMKLVYEITQTN